MSNIDFINACENGNLEMAQYLLNNLDSINFNYIFRLACKNGHLKVAQWLYSLNVNIHADNEYAFKWACRNGHLEVAQWLQSLKADIHAENECAFIWACYSGHLEVVQWLFQHGIKLEYLGLIPSDEILEKAFQLKEKEMWLYWSTMCYNNKNIKRLIEEGVNYEILDHFVFKRSCYNNNISMAEYLLKIDTRYYFEIDENNKIINYSVNSGISKNARNIN